MPTISKKKIIHACLIINYGVTPDEQMTIFNLLKSALLQQMHLDVINKYLHNHQYLPSEIAVLIVENNMMLANEILLSYNAFSAEQLTSLILHLEYNYLLDIISHRMDLTLEQRTLLVRKRSDVSLKRFEGELGNIVEIKRMVDLLFIQHQLNHIIILNFLCKGDVLSFAYAISKRTLYPYQKILEILDHPHSEEMQSLYSKANLPEMYFEFVAMVLHFRNERLYEEGQYSALIFRQELYQYLNNLNTNDEWSYFMNLIKVA